MTIARIVISVLISQWAYSQENSSNSLSLKILEDSLACNGTCDTLTVSFTLRNESKDDILIYGLKRGGPYPTFIELPELCDVKNIGTGIAFALYHLDGTRERPEFRIFDRKGQRKVTKEILDSALHAVKVRFLQSAMILKKNEERSFVKRVPLHNFNLENGLYYLQMVYYCGNKTAEVLDMNKIERSDPKLFQGCATSIKIPFVVN